jgi:hypothetical protein
MGKYYVTLKANAKKYQVCREDIHKVIPLRPKKLPRLPAFTQNEKEAD